MASIEVDRAPLFQRRGQAGDRTRYSNGGVALDVGVVLDGGVGEFSRQPEGLYGRRHEFVLQLEHVALGKPRRLHAVIDCPATASIEMDDHHAASPDAVHERLQHPHGKSGSDSCVDGVSAALQDFNARLRAERVLRSNHAVFGGDHLMGSKRGKTFSWWYSFGQGWV